MNDGFLGEVLEGTSFALFDGAMGTMLVREGLEAGELPELLCLDQPQRITEIHRAYVQAGSQFVTTNTFGANRLKLGSSERVREVYQAAVKCARDAGARYVAADIGPTGELIFPLGEFSFSEAYDVFAEQARAAQEAGADLILVETMSDVLEATAAVMAAKSCTSLPVFATMTFQGSGYTFHGTTPQAAALALAMLGVDALGVNCSAGPKDLQTVVSDILDVSPCPVIVQANAGLPTVAVGTTSYDLTPEEYAAQVLPMIEAGARIVGGCCGTDPDYIRELASLVEGREPGTHFVNRARALELARCEADEDGRDAEIIAAILEASDYDSLKAAMSEEFDCD